MGNKIVEVKNQAEFGNVIREEREKQKLTQAQVAKLAKMAPNYYSMVERGEKNVAFEKMINILKALKLKVVFSGV
jgi:transcriptional regulator with XRE-family HTH domain